MDISVSLGLQKRNDPVKALTCVVVVGGDSSVTLVWLTSSRSREGPECSFSLNNLSIFVSISPYGYEKHFFRAHRLPKIKQ